MGRCTCGNQAAKGRKKCWTCYKRQSREKDPVRHAFYDLRTNAKRRGKEFTLTLEEFRKFAKECTYYKRRGVNAKSYHIDRIDENGPYSIDNIQMITNQDNIKKYRRWVDYGEFRTIEVRPVECEALF